MERFKLLLACLLFWGLFSACNDGTSSPPILNASSEDRKLGNSDDPDGKLAVKVDFDVVEVEPDHPAIAKIKVTNEFANPVSNLRLDLPKDYAFALNPETSSCETVAELEAGDSCIFQLEAVATKEQEFNDVFQLNYKLSDQDQAPISVAFKGKIEIVEPEISDKKDELFTLLKSRLLDQDTLTKAKREAKIGDRKFSIDDKTGEFFTTDDTGAKHKLRLVYDDEKNRYLIKGNDAANLEKNPLPVPKEAEDVLNGIAHLQRQIGIFTNKSLNPECYFAYAAARFKSKDPSERLLALERSDDPRPLNFRSDKDWNEFKDDMRKLFKDFKGPKSYIAILGSGTTFFSENPHKGRNKVLFEVAPKCETSAADPKRSKLARTYNASGPERSDLDINILIPELSALCAKAFGENGGGNEGERVVYFENSLNKCFRASDNKAIADIFGPGKDLAHAVKTDSEWHKFFQKWNKKLNNMEINFSVRILPNLLKGAQKRADEDFENDPAVQSKRFLIPIN